MRDTLFCEGLLTFVLIVVLFVVWGCTDQQPETPAESAPASAGAAAAADWCQPASTMLTFPPTG